MKIVVWGLGKAGRAWISNFKLYKEDINANIIALVDSNVDKNSLGEYEQNLLLSKDGILGLSYDYIVVTSSKYFDEIKTELTRDFKVNDHKIISGSEFYEKKDIERKYECNICGSEIIYWEYMGQDNKLFSEKNVVGASYRKGKCPVCGASDRMRFEYYIVKKYTDMFCEGEKNILHFAPEEGLSDQIKLIHGKNYITADIVPEGVDVIADITNLQFKDESFNYIICNHVLEHISDEKAALNEMRRCLKTNGKAVVTVPICWEQKTFEDPDIVTPEARIEYYGQEDHVRLYGNDIISRFEQYGFKVHCYKNDNLFSLDEIKKYGFIPNDTVFILEK